MKGKGKGHSSLRVSEITNLKWVNVDRNRMVIYILDAKGGKTNKTAKRITRISR